MEAVDRGRRKIIIAIAALPLIVWSLWRYLVPPVKKARRTLEVAKGGIPERGALVFRESGVALIREEGKAYALSLVCTHLGCAVTVTPTDIVCPCHGSRFDRKGNVVTGPADRPLEQLQVEERGEFVTIILKG